VLSEGSRHNTSQAVLSSGPALEDGSRKLSLLARGIDRILRRSSKMEVLHRYSDNGEAERSAHGDLISLRKTSANATSCKLHQDGVLLCAKAQRRSAASSANGELQPQSEDMSATFRYTIGHGKECEEEIKLLMGSPIGEMAFFGESEQQVVRSEG
jgi:hypothetical protein